MALAVSACAPAETAIAFIVTVVGLESEVTIEIPEDTASDRVYLRVDMLPDGSLVFEDRTFARGALNELVSVLPDANTHTIFVRAGKEQPVGDIMDLMDALKIDGYRVVVGYVD